MKIGLALSGGGFRAAFFHVGVLARLAELGILPRVEVISTVSGGSIVGALYYIRLKRLLESRPDGEIGKDGYIELVADVERRLREGVQKNIRARVFANPLKNLEMLTPSYSRSDRIGDLYDRHLYKSAWEEPRESRGWGREKQIELRELLIEPAGESGFHPVRDNATRQEKIPILAINATALNSGHNWRFEATHMGEPLPEDDGRRGIIEEVDKNMRLEQGYFATDREPCIPESQRDFPLALAVAASACVPGVFHPLAISDLYQGIRVQLVDGGVQDNQGVQALRDYGCMHLVISDASGQMKDKDKPAPWIPGSLNRSMSVAGDRIRDEQLTNLPAGEHTLIHLRKGLEPETVPPLKNAAQRRRGAHLAAGPTSFGVDRRVQDALARVRTDLDYFGDTEAFSLALDGYLVSDGELTASGLGDGDAEPPDGSRWAFWAEHERIAAPTENYLRELRSGQRKFFRLFALRPALAWLLAVIGVVALGLALCIAWGPIGDLFDLTWLIWAPALAVVFFLAPFAWANLSLLKTRLYAK